MQLIERLLEVANMWSAANDRSLPRLATIVANDGKLFDRLANGATCTVATLERAFSFLADAENWPGKRVPDRATAVMEGAMMEIGAAHEMEPARLASISDAPPPFANRTQRHRPTATGEIAA